MTEQSSCKSFFGKYLAYRISAQKMNLVLCCILNVLALPLLFAAQIKGFQNNISDLYYVGRIMAVICGVFLMTLAVIGAVFSFEYCSKKELTDTVGSLPLTYRQRFWGDLLSGYIANVAPVIPCGLISAVIFSTAQSEFEGFCFDIGYGGVAFSAFQTALCMAFSLFAALTFTYLFAVLIVSATGKILHAVLFTILGTAALAGAATGLAGGFAVGMLGANTPEFMVKTAAFFPPLGSLIDLSNGIRFLGGGNIELYSGKWALDGDIADIFVSISALQIVYFVLLCVVITAGAYYIGKRRKPEKTGSAFVIKPMYYAISAFLSAAAVFIVSVLLGGATYVSTGIKLLVAAAAGAIAYIVTVVIYLPKVKELPKCIVCGAVSVATSVGIIALLKATCSFGLAYLPKNTDKIEYLKINDSYTVTDKSDMEKYIRTHNDILYRNKDKLKYDSEYGYTLEYQTTGGRAIKRGYFLEMSVKKEMTDNEHSLAGYGRYFFESLYDTDSEWECRIINDSGVYSVPAEYNAEFMETLREDAEEKYDPDSEVIARVEFANARHSTKSFDIIRGYEKTLAFLNSINGTAEKDPSALVLQINYSVYDKPEESRAMTLNIRNGDMDNELVKELIGLLKEYSDGMLFEADDADKSFVVVYKNVLGSAFGHYVPRENSKRVLEIMTELAVRG